MRKIATAFAVGVALAGCARSTPPTQELIADAFSANTAQPAHYAAEAELPVTPISDGWLTTFSDERLEALVDEAIRSNRDLAAAYARVEQAAARARQSGASLKPQLDYAASASSFGTSENGSSGVVSVGLLLTWELDVWGRLSSQQRAAREEFASVAADTAFAYQSLAAQVAKTWFQLIEAAQLQDLQERYAKLLDDNAKLIQLRRDVGRSSQYELVLARAEASTAHDRAEQALSAREDSARALEILLGRYPRAELDAGLNLPPMPPATPVGLPSELIERRPDLIAATRRVAAAFNLVESAKAARLPSLSLTASAGVGSTEFRDLTLDQAFWNVTGNLLGPIFDAGLRKEQVRIETAAQREALMLFAQNALGAFRQVETALSEESRLARRIELVTSAATDQREAVRLSEERLDAGTIDQVELITVQSRALQAEVTEIAVRAARLSNRVDLHLALGGDFAPRELTKP